MPTMTAQPEWQKVDVLTQLKSEDVDQKAGIIRNVILAEEGEFHDKRGEFDRRGIRQVVSLAKQRTGGLKARLGHPRASSDSMGKFLGRYHSFRSDTVLREVGKDASGRPLMKEILVARGDLHLDPTALSEPIGGGKPIGVYVMELAASDRDAFGASLVLKKNEEFRLDKRNQRLKDETGEDLPPLWFPTALHAADVVDDPDATNSFLSADILAGLPDAIVRQGCDLLDAQFANQDRDVIKARLSAFIDRYLAYRFDEDDATDGLMTINETRALIEKQKDELHSRSVENIEKPTDEPESPPAPVVSDDALRLDLYLAEQE